jgi:hypothetical protein
MSDELTPIQWQALKVAARSADRSRGDIQPGHYDVDMLVRISGVLEVHNDSCGAKTVTPDLVSLIGHLMSLIDEPIREQVFDQLHELYTNNDYAMPPVPLAVADRVEKMLERLRRTEQVTRRGAITGTLEVEPVRLGRSMKRAA